MIFNYHLSKCEAQLHVRTRVTVFLMPQSYVLLLNDRLNLIVHTYK